MTRVRVLTPVFFARFFDNEMAAGAGSLKTPFFWMVAFLAAPGMFMPVMMSFSWSFVAQFYSFTLLDTLVRADKVVYLGYGACASGLVIATAWNALLLDRRDGLVLGSLPVDGRDVVSAKLMALCGYVGLLMILIHAGPALMFGVFFPPVHGFASLLALTAAHFIASSAYGMFVCLAAVSLQGVLLGVAGPRAHAKLSPVLQLLVTAIILTAFFFIGDISRATVDTIAGHGKNVAPWILRAPTLWFLGLYEVILGFRDPILVSLAWRAVAALLAAAVVAAVSMPLSYRRLMIASVEQAPKSRRASVVTLAAHAIAKVISRHPPTRAIADFFLMTLVRHTRPRLAIALAAGATIAWALPIAGVALAKGVPAAPTPALLGTPLAAIFFLVIGFRMAASLPSELPPRWVFGVHGVPDRTTRHALRRVTLVLAVLLPTVISFVFFYRWWPILALRQAAVCVTTGLLLVEAAFARFEGVPCARVLHADGANLRTWWPLYLAAFVTISSGLPTMALRYRWYPPGWAALIWVPLALAVAVRIAAARIVPVPAPDDDELPPVQVLDI